MPEPTPVPTEIVVDPCGDARAVYGEAFDYGCLGAVLITRASAVEPDDRGRWWADLSPVRGPKLGPFDKRSAALGAEVDWLRLRLPDLPHSQTQEQ